MIISVGQVMAFLLMLARIMGIFIEAPLFNSRAIPVFVKIALCVWITAVLWFVTPVTTALPHSLIAFLVMLLSELTIGFIIGFICNILFLALQGAGEIMDMQMGLSVATALDPVFGAVISIIGRLIFMVALLVFLIINGHHLLLSTLNQSFTMIPAGHIANFTSGKLIFELLDLGQMLWFISIKLAAPIILLIFLIDFAFGIVSRVAPQVNVFMLGFQVKPALGLLGILFCAPLLINQIAKIMGTMAEKMLTALMYLK